MLAGGNRTAAAEILGLSRQTLYTKISKYDLESDLEETCYRFRCSLLHQGSTQHPKSKFERIIFIEPAATTNVVHYMRMNGALCIDLRSFCTEVLQGAHRWLAARSNEATVQRNMSRSAQRHSAGLAPYIQGVPVVG